MSIQENYDKWSAIYDGDINFTRDLDAVTLRAILADEEYESILEIGCGTGKNTEYLSKIGSRVTAVDFSEGMLSRAQAKLTSNNVQFVQMDISLPWKVSDNSFDLIACNLVLEHVRDLDHVFSEAYRSLKDAGRFVLIEFHPFRQYEGQGAEFESDSAPVKLDFHVHHVSDFTASASASGLILSQLGEHWHEADNGKPPRLISFVFEK